MTLTAVDRLNRGLGLDAVLVPSWSSLTLTAAGSRDTVLTAAVSPTAINMRRVAHDDVGRRPGAGRPARPRARGRRGRRRPKRNPSRTATFVVACATGAAALSVIFGATHPLAILLVALGGRGRRSAPTRGLGASARDRSSRPSSRRLLAGARRRGGRPPRTSATSTAVVAICPAMVLVPGPHILNGALDLLDLRVTLGHRATGASGCSSSRPSPAGSSSGCTRAARRSRSRRRRAARRSSSTYSLPGSPPRPIRSSSRCRTG